MNPMRAIIKKEFLSFVAEPLLLVLGVVFLSVSMALPLYFGGFFERDQADLQSFLTFIPWILLVLSPAVAMRAWADEMKSGTIETIFTMPVLLRDWVIGKFLSAWFLLIVLILCTLPMVVVLAYLGSPDWGVLFGGYIATILLAGAYLAAAQFASCLTKNQVIAFVLGLLICFILTMAGSRMVTGFAGLSEFGLGFLSPLLLQLSVQNYYAAMIDGAFALPSVLFFGLWIGLFQGLTLLALQQKQVRP
ncbi:MAG: ABC transporter permease [Alphaproteobacteria bacterium]|nr:MAG: ABC transporter permease [Alphaproteobacteria bacterium]